MACRDLLRDRRRERPDLGARERAVLDMLVEMAIRQLVKRREPCREKKVAKS
jgi:hypothetical protein